MKKLLFGITFVLFYFKIVSWSWYMEQSMLFFFAQLKQNAIAPLP